MAVQSACAPAGSSPLTRGKRAHSLRLALQPGLIPAHAGKTAPDECSRLPSPAHPRSRGENIQTAVQTVADFGSSPLTRGKPTASFFGSADTRLIPAHAGKTFRCG